jgi:small subunit ribosomal protein S8
MAQSDTISDLLTRLRNAVQARQRYVDMYTSKIKLNIMKVLEKQGFIEHVLVNEEKGKMRIFLKYAQGREPVLQGLKRISSPGLRRYIPSRSIPRIRGGMGTTILSTPIGIVDGETARKQNVGGELLCYVW